MVRTPAGDAFSRFVVLAFRLEGLLTAAGDELAGATGQSSARWRVLAAVQGEPRSVAQIARDWSLARQSVQRVADLLASDGLVSYEENSAHRRAKLVRLTPRGRRVLRRIQAAQAAWANELGSSLDEQDLRTAARVLEQVIEELT